MMKPWTYPTLAIISNIIFYNFLPLEGGGVSLVAVIYVPAIISISLIFTAVHYWLLKRTRNERLIFLLGNLLILTLTYVLFPGEWMA
jgi:ABC-type multidrug transport system permease subunit